ncbi:hypothetical protein JCM11491_002744 [Sporobolomyces phaffii]
MLNRLHRARIPLHQLVQPPPTACHSCPTTAAASTKGKQRQQVPTSRTGRATRTIDWSKPSTSAVPYSPSPRPLHSRSYSTSPSPSRTRTHDDPPHLDRVTLDPALAEPESRISIPTLIRSLSQSADPTLSRATFDRLFDRLHLSDDNAPVHLRELKRSVERNKGWKLNERQLRTVLEANLQREKEARIKQMHLEKNESNAKGKGKGKRPVSPPGDGAQDADRAIWAQRNRQNVSDRLWTEYLALVSEPGQVRKADRAEVARVAELFANCAAIRPLSTTRDQDGQAVRAYSLALDYAGRRRTQGTRVVDNDVGQVVRRMLKNGRDEEAMALLKKVTDGRRVLTVKAMRDIVRDHYEQNVGALQGVHDQSPTRDPHFLAQFDETLPSTRQGNEDPIDEYSHARRVLDQVCTSTSSAGLDELLRLRLERVDRLEELAKNPRGAFLKWMSVKGAARPEWIETALRMWEVGVEKGEDGENLVGLRYRKVLEALVLEACKVGKVDSEGQSEPVSRPSPLIDFAVNLAIEHFPLQVLIHHSHGLLTSLTVDSHSPDLACHLFGIVNSPPLDFAFARFQWSAKLLTPFARLFFSSRRFEEDRTLPIRLYLSWTASGLTFPAGLWDPLWRSLGKTGTIDDLERVLQDWEETGRGRAESRIVRQVLRGATSSGNVPRSLELFEFFRSRYAPPAGRSPSSSPPPAFERARVHPLVVPLDSYNAILDLLARAPAASDYRPRLASVFRSLVADGHAPSTATYNAFLAANVVRTAFSVADVDHAGVVYNKLVHAGLHPDRDTFGLLMHGFNRLALEKLQRRRGGTGAAAAVARVGTEAKQQSLGTEASLRTFRASLASTAVDLDTSADTSRTAGRAGTRAGPSERAATLARGRPVGDLMKILAGQARFEEAKQVGEEWWRAMIRLDDQAGGRGNGFWEGQDVADECAAMREAGRAVEDLESQALRDASRR